jgi:Protein of unknown function (DUF1549)
VTRRRTTGLLALLCAASLWQAMLGTVHAGKSLADKGKDHWAFQPVRTPAVPAVHDRNWVRAPIDAFVLARLEAEGLRPAATADKRTLLRRVSFDLLGLPPTPAELRAFLKDDSPQAFATVVDRLLARPEYGARWGRHWLDVARYAESNGYERDGAKPNAWRYRDYVLDAFNQDKPYDRFLGEQVAGDELPDWNAQTQIATTFLRLGTWDDEPANPEVDRYDQLDDVLGVTARHRRHGFPFRFNGASPKGLCKTPTACSYGTHGVSGSALSLTMARPSHKVTLLFQLPDAIQRPSGLTARPQM